MTVAEHVNIGYHLVLWQVFGESDVLVGGEPFALRADQAVWAPSGVRHSFTTRETSGVLSLGFAVEDVETVPRGPRVLWVGRDLYSLFIAHYGSKYTIIRSEADVDRQILALIEESPTVMRELPLPVSEPARLVAEALRKHPGDRRGVAELSAAAHVSVRTIERAFLSETGMTLRQWRLRHRMRVAGTLLRSHVTVDAVAHRVGYTTSSAFRRVFKEHHGISPSEFIARYGAER